MRLFMDNPRDCFSSSPVALPAFIPLKNVEKSPGQALETSILCNSLAWQGMSDPSSTIRSFTREKYSGWATRAQRHSIAHWQEFPRLYSGMNYIS